MKEKTKAEWAKYWADKGFSVIPVHYVKEDGSCSCAMGKACPSPGKHPAHTKWKIYQDKKADEHTLDMWFKGRFEKYNIGVVTGRVSNNIFVVDVDVGEGKDGDDSLNTLQLDNDDLPQTLEQITGSGGRHYFYQAPENHIIHTGANTLGSGIDTRGEGGFVVVAPSIHKSGGTYNLVEQKSVVHTSPEWLSDLSSESNFQLNGSGNGLNGTIKDRWGDLVDGRESYMVTVILGSIRTWYATKGNLPTLQELVDEAYPTYEMRAKARGDTLDEDGRGLDLFTYKCKYQLKRAKNDQLKILHNVVPGSENSLQNGLSSPSATDSEGGDQSAQTKTPLVIADWGVKRFIGEAPEQEWLIENILPRGIPGLIAAIGGLGKSYIMLDLAMKVAGGDLAMHQETALGGKVVKNGKVVFLGAEDSANSLHRRIQNIAGVNLLDRANGNLFVVPMPDAGGVVPFIQSVMGQYTSTPPYENIKKQLVAMDNLSLVIIDPLQAFAHADINTDPAAAQFFWSEMAELCAITGANVLVAHHMRKEGTFNIKKSVQARESIRGTTALVDGARWVYGLWQMPESDEIVVAQKLGFESGIGNCVMGGIVKVNDQADNSTRAFVRDENGLLVDRTMEVDHILVASAKLDKHQTATIFDEIEKRWGPEEPFSLAMNTHRSLKAYLVKEYGMPKRSASGYVDAWMDQGFIENQVHTAKTKVKGIRVIKKPDQPNWG